MAFAFGISMALASFPFFLNSVEATCLLNAVQAERRVNIESLDGASPVPFGLWTGDWESANLTTYVVKFLAEERLGYHSRVSGVGVSSATSIYATAGCRAPNNLQADLQCSSSPDFVHHAALEVWGLAKATAALQRLVHLPEVIPEDAGDIGYVGIEGMYVKTKQLRDAYRTEGLALEYYRSYDATWNRPSDYFDNYTALDPTRLKRCGDTIMFDSNQVDDYLRVTGDVDGVARTPDGSLSARCWHESWWFSPACRSNPEGCIPWVSLGDGWWVHNAMQKSAVFDMPLAIAVSKSLDTWTSAARRTQTLLYWWQPDGSLIDLEPTLVTFPAFNAQERAQRILTSMQDKTRISKWLHRHLGDRAPRLRELVLRARFTDESIAQMLLDLKVQQGNITQEEVACNWLKRNEDVWRSWIPGESECVPGMGLVGANGLPVRSRANASNCAWCAPGTSSTSLVDIVGTTYICEPCAPGRSQASPGQQECSQCSAGTFAGGYGSRECNRCNIGAFNAEEGQLTCERCPPTFTTSYMGATGIEACICLEGSYRGEDRQGECLPCVGGMTCPEGSDTLGYSQHHVAQHPVVPLLKPGFWSSLEQPLSVFRCDGADRCPGGTIPGSACAEGFEKRACAACHPDHAEFGSTCVPCAMGAARIMLFPVLPLVIVAIVIAAIYRSTSGAYVTWGSWHKGVGSTVFILLNHYHVVNIIGALISERSVSTTLLSIRVLSDVMSIFMPQCTGLRSFASRLILSSHGPGFLLLVFVLLWLASQLLGLSRPSLRMDKDRTLNCYMSLIMTFFTTVVFMSITIFKCTSNPNGVHTLVRDKSVTCYEEEWRQLVGVGVLAILLWCIGYGSVLLRAIYIASARSPAAPTPPRMTLLSPVTLSQSAPKGMRCKFHSAAFRTRWTFLFLRYRPDAHYWAMIIIGRGVLLNLGSLFIQSAVGQICWVLCVVTLYTFLIFMLHPWRHLLNNVMDGFVHMSLGLTCAIGIILVLGSGEGTEDTTTMAGHFLRANLAIAAVPFIPIAAMMMWQDRSNGAKERKDTDARLILNALPLMFEGTHDEQLEFLKNLTEHDYWIMSAAKNVLLMEHGHKKVRPGYSARLLSKLSRASVRSRTNDASLKQLFSDVSELGGRIAGAGVQETEEARADPELEETEPVCTDTEAEENRADLGDDPLPPLPSDDHSQPAGSAVAAAGLSRWRRGLTSTPAGPGNYAV